VVEPHPEPTPTPEPEPEVEPVEVEPVVPPVPEEPAVGTDLEALYQQLQSATTASVAAAPAADDPFAVLSGLLNDIDMEPELPTAATAATPSSVDDAKEENAHTEQQQQQQQQQQPPVAEVATSEGERQLVEQTQLAYAGTPSVVSEDDEEIVLTLTDASTSGATVEYIVDVESGIVIEVMASSTEDPAEVGTWDTEARRIVFYSETDTDTDTAAAGGAGGAGGGDVGKETDAPAAEPAVASDPFAELKSLLGE
jgi:hypothetical protein